MSDVEELEFSVNRGLSTNYADSRLETGDSRLATGDWRLSGDGARLHRTELPTTIAVGKDVDDFVVTAKVVTLVIPLC